MAPLLAYPNSGWDYYTLAKGRKKAVVKAFCADRKCDDESGRMLFEALREIELN